MRFSMTAALLAACALSACANGHEGNPDNQPYATDPTGAIATRPQFISTESYDPYGTPAPFADMQAGSVAITPAPSPPLNLSTQGQSPAPAPRITPTMPRPH
jgi:hypothetical protein